MLDGTIYIANNAFAYSELEYITLPTSLKFIGFDTFNSSKIKTINLKNVKVISAYAFARCEYLTDIYLGKELTTISQGAFDNCNNLTNVYYYGTKEDFSKIDIEDYANQNSSILNANIYGLSHRVFFKVIKLYFFTCFV